MKPRILYTGPVHGPIASALNKNIIIEHKPFLEISEDFNEKELRELLDSFKPTIIACSSKNARKALSYCLKYGKDVQKLVGINDTHLSVEKSHSFSKHISEEKNTESLISLLKNGFNYDSILFLSADISIEKNSEMLQNAGLNYKCFKAYESFKVYQDIDMNNYEAIVFSSYSGIDNFLSYYNISEEIICFCIAPKTSEYLRQFFNGQVITAEKANIDTLFQNIESYFNERSIT